jgi:hypothetical protein
VRNPRRLWEAASLSEQLGKTPAEIFGLDPDDELVCYSFNRAVITFSTALKEAIRRVTKDAKNDKVANKKMQNEMRKWLYSDNAQAPGRFRDPFKSGAVQKA